MNDAASETREPSADSFRAALVALNRQALCGKTDDLLAAATSLVVSCLAVEYCSLWERLDGHSMLLRAGAGWRPGCVGAQVERDNSAPAVRVVLSQEPLLIDDLSRDRRFRGPSLLSEHGVVSSVNVPIHGPEALFGVLGAHSARPRIFRPDEINALHLIAQAVATGLLCGSRDRRELDGRGPPAEQMVALGHAAAGMAHELRNPLTSIKGLIQVNQKEFEARGVPSEDLHVIEQEIRRMERSLEAFLKFARPPRSRRDQVDLAALIARVTALVQGRAKKQNVSIELALPPDPVRAQVDADQIQQLLLNLVLNALDAMPSGGQVRIALRHAPDTAAEVEVIDTGPGIAPHILPVVFDTFVSDKEAGVGLGLPVSRRIAAEHGGRLTAANPPGGGASFLLSLPTVGGS